MRLPRSGPVGELPEIDVVEGRSRLEPLDKRLALAMANRIALEAWRRPWDDPDYGCQTSPSLQAEAKPVVAVPEAGPIDAVPEVEAGTAEGPKAGEEELDRDALTAELAKERHARLQQSSYTDLRNTDYFVGRHGDEFRFDHSRGRWLMWERSPMGTGLKKSRRQRCSVRRCTPAPGSDPDGG